MSARPLLPGRAYTVRYRGQTLTVLAGHPCDAIVIAARLLGVWS